MRAIEEASRQHRVRLFGALQTEADKQGVVLLRMEDGSYAFAAQQEGEPLSGEDFEDLPYAKKMETEEAIAKLQVSMQDTLIEIHEWEHDTVNKITALNDQVALEVITRQIDFYAMPIQNPRRYRIILMTCNLIFSGISRCSSKMKSGRRMSMLITV